MSFPFGFPLFLTGFCLTGGMVAFSEAKTSTVRDILWLPALLGAAYFFVSADSPRLLFTSLLLDFAITGLASLVLYLWSRKVGGEEAPEGEEAGDNDKNRVLHITTSP